MYLFRSTSGLPVIVQVPIWSSNCKSTSVASMLMMFIISYRERLGIDVCPGRVKMVGDLARIGDRHAVEEDRGLHIGRRHASREGGGRPGQNACQGNERSPMEA